MSVKLDIQRLIDDLGGPAYVAAALGITRTTPYGWIKRRYISSRYLERIKETWLVNIDPYFME